MFAPNRSLDTMKLYTKAHGAKVCEAKYKLFPKYHLMLLLQTTNLIINLDHDEWIIDDNSKILFNLGFGETCPRAH
jgi:hypothetical protein